MGARLYFGLEASIIHIYCKMWILLLGLFVLTGQCTADTEESEDRKAKLLPIFQVVRFPNDVCAGTTRNGTCFTAEECSSKGGTNDGSCASGFGVCCVVKLACGGSTSNNNSYIVQSSVTTLTSPCTYEVCPCNTDICRIRYDFTTHIIALPVTSTTTTVTNTAMLTKNMAVGDCVTDTFNINSPGKFGSPIICGTNTGQHMILDVAGNDCQTVNFHIGSETTTTRSWDIYVTQYSCGQEELAGAPGCLQFHTGTTGLIKSFNYGTANTATATAPATTHLQNQDYTICLRREAGYCLVCYSEWATSTAALGSFGLSISNIVMSEAASVGLTCVTDYLDIPNGDISAIAVKSDAAFVNRYCGRLLSTALDSEASETICTRGYPFTLHFHTDDNEECSANTNLKTCEDQVTAAGTAGGILGFAIGYSQSAC